MNVVTVVGNTIEIERLSCAPDPAANATPTNRAATVLVSRLKIRMFLLPCVLLRKISRTRRPAYLNGVLSRQQLVRSRQQLVRSPILLALFVIRILVILDRDARAAD